MTREIGTDDAYSKGRGPSTIRIWSTEGKDARKAGSLWLGSKGVCCFCDLVGTWFRDLPYVLRRQTRSVCVFILHLPALFVIGLL